MKARMTASVLLSVAVFFAGIAWAGYEGTSNNFYGTGAGTSITTGTTDTFIGANSGHWNTSGFQNTFIGYQAGIYNQTADNNTFIGAFAGDFNQTGGNNTFVGTGAGFNNLTGSGNVYLGNFSGYSETGSNMLYIDNCYSGVPCTTPLIKGDFHARTLQIDGSLTMVSVATPSDERYKQRIQPLKSSLEKVMNLQGVSYEWKKDVVTRAGFKDGRQIGLIAQEVEKILPELVHTDDRGYKYLSYDKIVPVLIEAVKEQQKTIADNRKVLDEQKQIVIEQKKTLEDQQNVIRLLTERLAKLDTVEARLNKLESKDLSAQK